jgi:RNA polymerase sigma-70 factor, ECF subfamily
MADTVDPDDLYRTHWLALHRRARRLTGCEQEADDLVQATFERSLRKLSTFQPGTQAGRWLGQIMHRLFIDDWRRRRRAPVPVPAADLEVSAPEPEDLPWWRSLSAQDLREAARELPPDLRQVFEGHVFEGQSYTALAARLGIPPSTVGSRLHRTRRRLRAVLVMRHHGQPSVAQPSRCGNTSTARYTDRR